LLLAEIGLCLLGITTVLLDITSVESITPYTLMGTPTARSLRAKTGSFSNNYRGWNKFQTIFSLLHKTTSNIATFRSELNLLQATLHKSAIVVQICVV